MNLRLRSLLLLLPCAVLWLLGPASARANTISGTVYCDLSTSDANDTPAPGVAHSGTQCATFTSSNINFSNGTGNTLGAFLHSGNLIGSVNYLNGYTASSSLDLSLFLFTGTAYFVQGGTYSATHDDGTVMQVGSTIVLNSPGATPPITNSFTFAGPTGNYAFQYNYTEALGGSTYTTNATASPVPEPGSLALLGTGSLALLALGGFRSNLGASALLE